MTQEAKAYKINLESFSTTIETAFVSRIIFDIDSSPTFDIKNIPFDFDYCNSVSLITNKGNFQIGTSITSESIDGLWVFSLQEIDQSKKHISVNSKIKNIAIELGLGGLPFKMAITFETKNLLLYSGEIYDKSNGGFDYKINDEMILAFNEEKQAAIFENLVNYG